jgi:hypothetical protein
MAGAWFPAGVDVWLFAQARHGINIQITRAAGAILYGSAARHATKLLTITVRAVHHYREMMHALSSGFKIITLATAWQRGKQQDDST